MQDAGCRMLDIGYRMLDAGCRMPDLRCRMLNVGCRIEFCPIQSYPILYNPILSCKTLKMSFERKRKTVN